MNYILNSLLRTHHPKDDYVLPQQHSAMEIVLYLSGSGTTTINDVVYKYSPGSIAVILPQTIHDETAAEESEVFFCIFEAANCEIRFENAVLNNQSRLGNELYERFVKMETELRQKLPHADEMNEFYLGEIAILLGRVMDHRPKPSKTIEYAKRMLIQNAPTNINMQLISESLGYSYDRFRHIFKEKTGISPAQYYINAKMSYAKRLLQQSQNSVETIAKLCGFHDATNFITTFRNRVGITPLKYRNLICSTKNSVLNFHRLDENL